VQVFFFWFFFLEFDIDLVVRGTRGCVTALQRKVQAAAEIHTLKADQKSAMCII
jgi:hypothetical protein